MGAPLRKIKTTDVPSSLLPLRSVGGVSLSQILWKLDWERHVPIQLDKNTVIEMGSYELTQAFAKEHFAKLYGIDAHQSPFYRFDNVEIRQRYYEVAGDFLSIRHEGKIAGIFVGNAFDWTTYYLRNLTILSEHHGKHICQAFLNWLIGVLSQYPIDRIEADVAPSSRPNVHILNKLKFEVTGQTLSERWGAITRFTLFLNPESAKIFRKQFCCGLSPEDKKV